MTRTTTRRQRDLHHFLTDNRRLFPFAGLFLLGVAVGVAVYLAAPALPEGLLNLSATDPAAVGWGTALWNSLFSPLLMLAALYLLGLWGCGAPFILAVPLFHGLGLGLTEAHLYRTDPHGIATVATLVMPIGLLTAAVLTTAGAESLRLSVRLSRQLLPGGGDSDLPACFRLYSLRFLILLGAAATVALLEVLLHRIQ